VERILEFLDVPKEPPAVIESQHPPAYWPSTSGSNSFLVVENLEVRYDPTLPNVLHGLSFSLAAGERIGIVGRTGSGKSTLVSEMNGVPSKRKVNLLPRP